MAVHEDIRPVLDMIGDAGFEPVYGARPLKRVIKARIEKELAKHILAGHFKPGDTIEVNMDGEKVTFTSNSINEQVSDSIKL